MNSNGFPLLRAASGCHSSIQADFCLDSGLRLRFAARAEAAGPHAIESARGDWRKHVLASDCWRWGHDAPVAAMSEDAMHDEPDEKGERKPP
jgi:hypothetical protein